MTTETAVRSTTSTPVPTLANLTDEERKKLRKSLSEDSNTKGLSDTAVGLITSWRRNEYVSNRLLLLFGSGLEDLIDTVFKYTQKRASDATVINAVNRLNALTSKDRPNCFAASNARIRSRPE